MKITITDPTEMQDEEATMIALVDKNCTLANFAKYTLLIDDASPENPATRFFMVSPQGEARLVPGQQLGQLNGREIHLKVGDTIVRKLRVEAE
jgi:hypothetical protein